MTKTTETTAAAPAAPAIPAGYMEAADGTLVPKSKVSELDLARDKLVRELVGAAKAVNGQLGEFKRLAMQEVTQFCDMSAASYGVTMRGAAGKGNVTLTTFDGRFKVQRAVAERVGFDERLQAAKAAIDQCVLRWGKGSNDNIKALVNHAFRVDKVGNVSVSAILKLRQVEIDDEQWVAAMKLIADSMHALSSVAYLRFYQRNDATGEYVAIPLDMAAV